MTAVSPQKPRVCFFCLYCYPLFNSECNYPFGGWETRISIIAKELAKRGNFDVTIFVADYGQPHVEYREGVRLISCPGYKIDVRASESEATQARIEPTANGSEAIQPQVGPNAIEPEAVAPVPRRKPLTRSIEDWLRTRLFPGKAKTIGIFLIIETIKIAHNFCVNCLDLLIRSTSQLLHAFEQAVDMHNSIFDVLDPGGAQIIWRKEIELFDEVQADIYVVPGNHRTSAIAACYAQARHKRYVFLAGSDYDYYPEYKTNPDGFDLYGESYFQKAYAIERANLHIVQTPQQANMLQQGYGRSSIVIRNPIDLNISFPRRTSPKGILWVGKSDERIKRPSLVLELARRLPEQEFLVILNRYDDQSYACYSREALSLSNIVLIEQVPFNEVERYYAAARLFVSTSVFEGFPNTFLQAAKYGVPIVSTNVDPGGMLSEHGSGIVCGGDFERFVESVKRLLTDDELYTKMSAGALNYVRTHHDKDIIIEQYEEAFRGII